MVAAFLGLAGPAYAALPANVISDIYAAAAGVNAVTVQERAVGAAIGERSLQWIQARRAQASADQALSVVVADAIARHPLLTAEIIAAAVTAAPASRNAIARNAARNYPGFAALIYQAAGVAPAPPAPRRANARQPALTYRAPPVATSTYRSTRAAYNPAYRISLAAGQTPANFIQPVYRLRVAAVKSTPPPAAVDAGPMEAGVADGDDDPLEDFNRVVFAVNDGLDIMIFRPLAALYGYLTPWQAKAAARRFFKNLTLPVVMINDLAQLDGADAAVSAGRFIINTTAGVLGLFDPATEIGLTEHYADFGQSLHSYGVGPGPYIVLPLLGPSTLRDSAGLIVDFAIDPFNTVLKSNLKAARRTGSALVTREDRVFPLDELRSSSVDYYSALRSAYRQKRAGELRKGRGGGKAEEKAVDDMFNDAE